MDEETLIVWQDVLDEIFNGRGDGLSCPACSHTPLEVTRTPDGMTKITCRGCGKVLEGRFGSA